MFLYYRSTRLTSRLVNKTYSEPQAVAHVKPVAPVAYQVILEPDIGQLREFEPRRVHTYSYKFFRAFSCAQIDLRKARERELVSNTHSMKNRRAVGLLNPIRDKN